MIMKHKKMIIILILLIFTTGMIMGAASASHTFKDKGYSYKMSTKQVKKMKKVAKKEEYDIKRVKVSKTKNIKSYDRLKVGKTYTLNGKMKVLKFIKRHEGTGVGDSYNLYKVRQYRYMDCYVDYYKGKYTYSAYVV